MKITVGAIAIALITTTIGGFGGWLFTGSPVLGMKIGLMIGGCFAMGIGIGAILTWMKS